ncbi:hypothetical protein MAR_021175 [Mya arenaria]|uniref:MACPF domain-containing protein n=1 Tax=Mya arenaria TaxID=6604 RepID=A0ABY7EAX2_MYAAR|nr:hypothetical protein MAR_021175 [Mya arenaria]
MWSTIFCACAWIAVSQAATLPEALHYIGVGYNMLKGNPDGDFWARGGDDPGLLSTRKVLSLSSNTDVPAEIVYEHHDQCRQAHEFAFFYDPQSYQNKLMERVQSSGTNNDALKAVAFTQSAGKMQNKSLLPGFKAVEQQTRRDFYVFQDDQTTCTSGAARYKLSLAQGSHYRLTDEFAAAVCSLPLQYNPQAYKAFLDTWGTHVTSAVETGSKVIKRYVSPVKTFVESVMVNSSRDVSIGGAYMNHASSLVVDVPAFRYRQQYRNVVGVLEDTLSLGSEANPEPIGYSMVVISDMLDSSHWQSIDDLKNRGLCPPSTEAALTYFRTNLEKAINEYAGALGAVPPICKCLMNTWDPANFIIPVKPVSTIAAKLQLDNGDDDCKNNNDDMEGYDYFLATPLAIPVTWPQGTYSFAKPKSGCPAGDFTWYEGWRLQDTETQSPDNAWSVNNHFAGKLAAGEMQLEFCTKGEAEPTDFDRNWPAGDYCIFKYGACPAAQVAFTMGESINSDLMVTIATSNTHHDIMINGFDEGYVLWDDEDSMNRNDWQGVLPDGTYDEDTLQRYCCRCSCNFCVDVIFPNSRSDGMPTEAIVLPTDKPFYLFQYTRDVCQKVANMHVAEEWLRWDDEDFKTPSDSKIGAVHPEMQFWNEATGASGSEIYYCYYSPQI